MSYVTGAVKEGTSHPRYQGSCLLWSHSQIIGLRTSQWVTLQRRQEGDDSHDILNPPERIPGRKHRWGPSVYYREGKEEAWPGRTDVAFCHAWCVATNHVVAQLILFKFNEPEQRQKIELKFLLRIYVCKERIMRQKNSVQIHLTLDWSSCPQLLKMHWRECSLKQETKDHRN